MHWHLCLEGTEELMFVEGMTMLSTGIVLPEARSVKSA